MFLHLDCRYYLGDRPCKFNRLCEGCPHYLPMGPRVLIIKLGALGDVVRTGALLPGLTQLTAGEPPYVTWLTSPAAVDLVKRMPGVHRVLAFKEDALASLRVEKFDLLICLDKEAGPCSVAMSAQAERKLGVGLSRYGTPFPLNDAADYYFQLGLDNDEKFFKNQKSYQQLMYEALGMAYNGERFEMELTEADRASAEQKFSIFEAQANRRVKPSLRKSAGSTLKSKTSNPKSPTWIGINPGAGGVFAYKAWREEGYVNLIRAVSARRPDVRFVLLGGKEEEELLDRLYKSSRNAPIFHAGTDNTLGEFTALIDRCDLLVCGDTLAMHLAIARRRPVVALFGPTCEQEIDLFGNGVKIKSPIACSPCYLRKCDKDPTCQDLISDAQVIRAVNEQLQKAGRIRL